MARDPASKSRARASEKKIACARAAPSPRHLQQPAAQKADGRAARSRGSENAARCPLSKQRARVCARVFGRLVCCARRRCLRNASATTRVFSRFSKVALTTSRRQFCGCQKARRSRRAAQPLGQLANFRRRRHHETRLACFGRFVACRRPIKSTPPTRATFGGQQIEL